MLTVVTTKGSEYDWHVGSPLPKLIFGENIHYITVDGDELMKVFGMFPFLIPPQKRVVRIPAPFAQLVWCNL